MKRKYTQRGSALMLTIGLLSILVMLGMTFLVVSHLDAKEAEAVITRNQSVPVASGVVFRAMEVVKRDLRLGDSGPFSDPSILDQATTAMAYADIPYRIPRVDTMYVPHDMYIQYVSNDYYQYSLLYPTGGAKHDAFDSDDDGIKDSLLVPAEGTSSMGHQYWLAVKVVDLAGRVCVNTAAKPDAVSATPTVPRSPILYNLEAMLNVSTYSKLHKERCGNEGGVTKSDYHRQCGRRLLVPDVDTGKVPYRPFAVGDEMYLHYFNDDSVAVKAGRLRDVLQGLSLSDDMRSRLTTYSCTRKLPRLATKLGQRLSVLDLSTQKKRDDLYESMLSLLQGANVADAENRKEMAASFVANLLAYTSPDNDGRPWKFSAGGMTAYGLRQSLVITEAYAAHKPEEVKDSADHIAGFAVELFNPTTDKDVNLNGWKIKLDDKTVSLSGNVPRNGHAVLYSYVEGENYSKNFVADDRKDHTGLDPGANWYELGKSQDNQKIDFTKIDRVLLLNGDGVPVDEVLDDDGLDYGSVDIQTEGGSKKSIQRDDDPDRHRYNIAVYKTDKNHALGKANKLDPDELMPDMINGAPIVDIDSLDDQKDLISVAELGRIYLAGTTIEGGKTTVFSRAIIEEQSNQPIFPDVPGRGRLNFLLADVPQTLSTYPRVPVGCLTGEFFTIQKGDQTRPDDLRRYYGLINVNNAYRETLRNLPWPKTVTFGGKDEAIDANEVVKEVIRYREAKNLSEWGQGLRQTSGFFRGFYTPGEIAIPLAAYMNRRLGCSGNFPKPESNANDLKIVLNPDYLEARDALYRAVADLVTVRSDTFAVVIHVQVGDKVPAKHSWKYLAIIDRSNVNTPEDNPAVILFTPLK